jgi:hypothetical protein
MPCLHVLIHEVAFFNLNSHLTTDRQITMVNFHSVLQQMSPRTHQSFSQSARQLVRHAASQPASQAISQRDSPVSQPVKQSDEDSLSATPLHEFSSTKLRHSETSQVPGRDEDPNLGPGYDNVPLGHGYCTPRGAVVHECGAIVKL